MLIRLLWNCWTFETLDTNQSRARVYAIASGATTGFTVQAVSQSSLVGLSRIIASELPDIWGAMIDVYSTQFLMEVLKHIETAGCCAG